MCILRNVYQISIPANVSEENASNGTEPLETTHHDKGFELAEPPTERRVQWQARMVRRREGLIQ